MKGKNRCPRYGIYHSRSIVVARINFCVHGSLISRYEVLHDNTAEINARTVQYFPCVHGTIFSLLYSAVANVVVRSSLTIRAAMRMLSEAVSINDSLLYVSA